MSDASRSVRFVDTHGQLPEMSQRRVAFFANLLALFFGNEEQTQSLKDEVGEIDSYGGRLIPILNLIYGSGGNALVLEREPDPELCRYLADELGLSLPRLRVLRNSEYVRVGEQLREPDGRDADGDAVAGLDGLDCAGVDCVDGYVTDETLTAIARHWGCKTLTTIAASRDGNNKLLLHEHMTRAGMPVFDTVVIETAAELGDAAQSLAELGYREAVVRAQIGASGIGMLRLRDLSDLAGMPSIPAYFFFEGHCLVQGWLEPGVNGISRVYSPSTQLYVDENSVSAFDMTEQILSSDSIHQGNESPPPYFDRFEGLRAETMRQADVAGRWLHSTGYRGTASIDWLVVEREASDTAEVYVCEINARVTGATYPSLLARHFYPSGAWLLRNLRLRTPLSTTDLLRLFRDPGHLFFPDHESRQPKTGVLPLNLNFGSDGLVHKGQFLCIGATTAECHELLQLAEQDLPVAWDDDRD